MSERWRKPVKFLAAGQTNEITQEADGRRFHEPELSVDAETWERIRVGYVCPKCLEPHETPFPKACGVCGLARNEQQTRVNVMFAGFIPDGESYADEEAALQLENEQRMYVPGSSIILPRGVNLD